MIAPTEVPITPINKAVQTLNQRLGGETFKLSYPSLEAIKDNSSSADLTFCCFKSLDIDNFSSFVISTIRAHTVWLDRLSTFFTQSCVSLF